MHRKLKDSSDLLWDGISKIETGSFSMKRNDETFFDDFKKLLIREFKDYGVSKNNYNIFWKDKDDHWVRVTNNDGFVLAMDKIDGPEYKLIAQLEVGT